ncbi:hypothetical protein V5799_012562 [Amblyomma americanum]|uniref:P2X purinoreceptor 7 intracellular domain-containing protein n=1 Tax=Amblyomma americanum TaxID=6943 RepID=A0AAQ4EDS8_AMBAM
MEGFHSTVQLGTSPYLFEPDASPQGSSTAPPSSDSSSLAASESDEAFLRVGNVNWCSCKHCAVMTEKEDCLCCQEVPEITGKQKRARCITTTKKFKDVCLNKAVLEVALARQESRASRNDRGSVNKRMSTLILAELLLWDLWKTAAEWWARFWGSFPFLGLRALSHGHNLVEEAFDVACATDMNAGL